MQYELPKEERGREKIIGGILDMVQTGWILLGILIGGGIAILTYPIFGGFGLFLGIAIAPIGTPMAFIKIKGFTLTSYLLNKKKFEKKEKVLIKKRLE